MQKSFDDLISGLTSVVPGGKSPDVKQLIFKGVVIVGSSCSGKTTVAQAVRGSSLPRARKVSVPQRYITRSPRINDLAGENVYLSQDEFMQKVRCSEICFYWKKLLEPEKEELFGFGPTPEKILPVYAGNNGLFNNAQSVYPDKVLEDLFFVGIYAPDEIRRERFFMRSPDVAQHNPQEARFRLDDSSEKTAQQVHTVINNYGPSMRFACQDTIELIRRMVDVFGWGKGA